MLITINETKTILQLPDDSKDSIINGLLPTVEGFVLSLIDRKALDTGLKVIAGDVQFDGDTSQITAGTFYNDNLSILSTAHVKIKGSKANDGVYTISSKTSTILTVTEDLITEDNDESYSIEFVGVKIPGAIKLAVAKLIAYRLVNTDGKTGMSYSDVSVSYDGNWHQQLLNDLKSWRKVRFY